MNKFGIIILFIFSYFTVISQQNTEIILSHSSGFYDTAFVLKLTPTQNNINIFYTSDGTKPTTKSKKYDIHKGIKIDSTCAFRAIAVDKNGNTDKEVFANFFINKKHWFSVISFIIDPNELFNDTTGIYVKGLHADTIEPYYGANFWKKWERPAWVEIYLPNQKRVVQQMAGIRLFGGFSRILNQKSWAVFARKKYGNNRFYYPLFNEKDIKAYKSFILRNSGGDWHYTMFRDILMTGLVKDIDIDIQAYRPVIAYINGRYWGIYNMREKINEHYIEENHHIDKDSIDLLEHEGFEIKHGDNKDYLKLLNFIKQNSFESKKMYDSLNKMMDINNYIKYSIAQIYFDNQDKGGNIRYWKSNRKGARWRWILYDTDWGFGLHCDTAYMHNTLVFATEKDHKGWPNPPWTTLILRKLMENNEFRISFARTFADYLNSIFKPEVVLYKIEFFEELFLTEIEHHFKRWDYSPKHWRKRVNVLKIFAQNRPYYMRKYLKEYFELTDTLIFFVEIEDNRSGYVLLNNFINIKNNWQGIYFSDIPVSLTAYPYFGYKFSHWQCPSVTTKKTIAIQPQTNTTINAVFKPNPNSVLYKKLRLSELAIKKNKIFAIEFFNNSNDTILLKNYWLIINQSAPIKLNIDTVLYPNKLLYLEPFFIQYDLNTRNTFKLKLYDSSECFIDSISISNSFKNTHYQLIATDSAYNDFIFVNDSCTSKNKLVIKVPDTKTTTFLSFTNRTIVLLIIALITILLILIIIVFYKKIKK